MMTAVYWMWCTARYLLLWTFARCPRAGRRVYLSCHANLFDITTMDWGTDVLSHLFVRTRLATGHLAERQSPKQFPARVDIYGCVVRDHLRAGILLHFKESSTRGGKRNAKKGL
jgi:hypothetical protein